VTSTVPPVPTAPGVPPDAARVPPVGAAPAASDCAALVVAFALLAAGGVTVALVSQPPIRYLESTSLLTGFVISIAVGIAAGLATSDDVGRREMIGLAATAQVAIIPVWFGASAVLGFPFADAASPQQRALSLLLNVVGIVLASIGTYAALRMKGSALRVFQKSRT